MLYRVKGGEIGIRSYQERDLDFLKNIDLKSYDMPWCDVKWNDVRHRTHVAETVENGQTRTVGFWTADFENRIIRATKLAITPSFRRRRIGTALLHDLCRTFPTADTITFAVGDSQQAAQFFLKDRGLLMTSKTNKYPIGDDLFETGYFFQGKITRADR